MTLVCNEFARRQRGISSITAIFLVTVLAALAAAGVQMWRSAQDDQTLDMQSVRARSAARAGLQAGFWLVAQGGACVTAAPTTSNFVLPGTLAPYRVTLTCTREGPYTDGAAVYRHSLTAVACNQVAGCPYNGVPAPSGYVEAIVYGECVAKSPAFDCRETR
jgi:hypothetical protein